MDCPGCNYALWNLTNRQCPECGRPWKPSEFDFTLNSVQFKCPHCAQSYYGTGEKGHLIPSSFECVSCHRPIAMDECVLEPTEGVSEDRTKVAEQPWHNRAKIGRFRAFFRTILQSCFAPHELMGRTPPSDPPSEAVLFGVLANAIYGALGLAVCGAMVWGGGGASVGTIAAVLGGFVAIGVFVGLWVVAAHFIAIGGSQFTESAYTEADSTAEAEPLRIGRAVQAIAYSSAAMALAAVPCLGMWLAPISVLWWAVCAGVMISVGYRTTTPRAVLAGLAGPAIAVCLAVIGISIAAITENAATPGGIRSVLVAAQNPVATQIYAALRSATSTGTSGEPPMHVAEALVHYTVMPDQLRVFGTSMDYPVVDPTATEQSSEMAGHWIFDLETVSRLVALNTPRPDSGDILVAHRLGDYVFCYHGLDWNDSAQSSRWVFFTHPEPGLIGDAPRAGRYCAVHLDGTIENFADANEFFYSLGVEMGTRERLGLPVLADPDLVFSGTPRVLRPNPPQTPADATSDEVPMPAEPIQPSEQVLPNEQEEKPR